MNVPPRDTEPTEALLRLPEVANAGLGLWLFTSAFVLHHADMQQNNIWVAGLFCVGVALFAMVFPFLRHVNVAVGLWIVVTTLAFPKGGAAALVDDLVVAVIVMAVSLTPNRALKRVLRVAGDEP